MRIAFAGTPATAVASLDALIESNHQVVGVITRPDKPAGRGGHLAKSAVSERAAQLGLPILAPASPKDPAFVDELTAWDLDAVAVVAYGALLGESVLRIPRHGWINLHFSLLPAWRGAAPVQRAIWAGDSITGATTFEIVKELDAGPVYGVMTYAIPPRATAGEVLDELAVQGAKLLVGTMDAIASGQALAVPQSADGLSYASKITPAEAQVDWSAPAFAIGRQVRACTPAPGAWTMFRGRRLKLGPVGLVADAALAALPDSSRSLAPGALAASKRAVLVGTGNGLVELGLVEAEGRKPMAAADWARGARLGPDERLGE